MWQCCGGLRVEIFASHHIHELTVAISIIWTRADTNQPCGQLNQYRRELCSLETCGHYRGSPRLGRDGGYQCQCEEIWQPNICSFFILVYLSLILGFKEWSTKWNAAQKLFYAPSCICVLTSLWCSSWQKWSARKEKDSVAREAGLCHVGVGMVRNVWY